jgi:hypothetical protein
MRRGNMYQLPLPLVGIIDFTPAAEAYLECPQGVR